MKNCPFCKKHMELLPNRNYTYDCSWCAYGPTIEYYCTDVLEVNPQITAYGVVICFDGKMYCVVSNSGIAPDGVKIYTSITDDFGTDIAEFNFWTPFPEENVIESFQFIAKRLLNLRAFS